MLDDELHLGELAASAREDNVGVDDAYALFLDWNRRRGTNLWPHQDDACLALALGDHVILGTPTGSGKSTVALWLAFLALCTGKRMYYTAPIKALVSEKFFDFSNLLGRIPSRNNGWVPSSSRLWSLEISRVQKRIMGSHSSN